jgi:general secretion pathway protein E
MSRLGDRLIAEGLVEKAQLAALERESLAAHVPLWRHVLGKGIVSEEALLPVLASLYSLEYRDPDDLLPSPGVSYAVPAKLATHYRALPLALDGGRLLLAVSDPLDLSVVEDIETNLGVSVDRVLAPEGAILHGLRNLYGVGADTVERILAGTSSARPRESTIVESQDLESSASDASVARLVNQLLHEAIVHRATDLHLEMQRGGAVVRRRIDGMLYDAPVPQQLSSFYGAIVARIKLMASLNIVERRLPQDGRARVNIDQTVYDLRVSTVPSLHGEDVVVRILPTSMLFDLRELGYTEQNLTLIEGLLDSPHGILFMTGPTGSGKSTTLYACLSRLNSRQRKIITIEDPIEYEMPGVTQTQINPKIGLDFARSLRSMLRHDPDVMMVGEVRDRETAEIAIQTAMTGHLVLSTLHTNDAAGASTRLMDMGIDPFLITSTVRCFAAQRLVRRICVACRVSEDRDGTVVYHGAGCRACGNTGYTGRLAISEFLLLSPAIQQLILDGASAPQIRTRADEEGMGTLLADGMQKASQGVTTAEEVMRVVSL